MTNWFRRIENAWLLRRHPGPSKRPEDSTLKPVTVVTGGTEGIGRALASEFARSGDDILLVARDSEKLAAAARELESEFKVAAHWLAADLTSPEGCASVVEALAARGLHADVLVNNAAIGRARAFAEDEHEELMRVVDLNVRALTDLMRRLLPGMLRRGRGGVLNVASVAGYLPGPYQAAYYASKAYVISLTEAVAYETRGMGVRVSLLIPGPVETRFHERMGGHTANLLRVHPMISAERVARIGYQGFCCRRLLITPGLIPSFNTLAARLIPHMILTPFMGWLLKRRAEGKQRRRLWFLSSRS